MSPWCQPLWIIGRGRSHAVWWLPLQGADRAYVRRTDGRQPSPKAGAIPIRAGPKRGDRITGFASNDDNMGLCFLVGIASGCRCNPYDDERYGSRDCCRTNAMRYMGLRVICAHVEVLRSEDTRFLNPASLTPTLEGAEGQPKVKVRVRRSVCFSRDGSVRRRWSYQCVLGGSLS